MNRGHHWRVELEPTEAFPETPERMSTVILALSLTPASYEAHARFAVACAAALDGAWSPCRNLRGSERSFVARPTSSMVGTYLLDGGLPGSKPMGIRTLSSAKQLDQSFGQEGDH